MRLRYHAAILLLILLFTAPELAAQRRGRAAAPASPPRPVATVNGKPIPYDSYHDAVQDQMRFQRRAGTAAVVDDLVADTILLGLVDDELIRQEAERRRFAVSRSDAVAALLKDPPEFMRAPFIDDRGEFRREVFEMVVRDPAKIVRLLDANIERDSLVRQWKEDLDKVILYMQARENRRRVTDAIVAETPLSADDIRERYFAEKTRVIGSFVRVLHSTIPDSLVPISGPASKAWFEAHTEDYWRAPARLIGIAVLPIDPTPADSVAHRARVDSIRNAIVAAPTAERAGVVAEIQRMLPPNRFGEEPILPSRMSNDMLQLVAKTPEKSVAGPFPQEGESTMLFVERRVPVRDTVIRARHILIRAPSGDVTTDSIARELITMLRDSIDNEEEFMTGAEYFSADAGGAQKGDLGYFGRGRMTRAFDSAAFAAPVGKLIGPVRTEYGYHLIWVNERLTDGFVVRELRVPISVSADARAAVTRDAEALATAMRTGVGVDSLVRVFRGRYPMMATDTTYVKRLERYGDVLAPARFAFDAKVGDVKIVPLPLNRLMVVRLNGIWAGGTPPYDDIKRYPEAHARRHQQLEMLGPRMKAIAGKLTPDMLIGPLRELAPDAEVFLLNDRFVTAPPDEEETILDSLVTAVPRQSVGGPVRGVHGYYFLRVLERSGPTEADYQRDREEFAEGYRQRRRDEIYRDLVTDLRAHAAFVDMRPATAP